MKKKLTALLLVFCMLLPMTVSNIGFVRAAENPPFSVSVTYEGSEIEEISVPQNEKKTVTAVCEPAGEESLFQWQISTDVKSKQWMDIYNQTSESLGISYALLSGVLDGKDSAYVRCKATVGGQDAFSRPLSVTISEPKSDADSQSAEAMPTEPQMELVTELSVETPAEVPTEDIDWAAETENADQAEDSESGIAPFAEDEPETPASYVTITVNYKDAVSGKELYGSHISTIETGTLFTEIVHSPTFLGFAPYYYSNELGKDWNSINKDITDPDNTDNPEHASTTAASAGTINFGELLNGNPVNEDITINVYYWAVDVPYAVKYFFQNINDDYYTEQTGLYYVGKAKTGTIIKDEELLAGAGNPVGFSALYHYPESVAADGSTVFECYYDRNYYFMKFDLDGGYGADPIYARYDTPVVVNNPTRPGYTFAGWDELTRNEDGTYSGGDGQPDTVPDRITTENKYYKALWEKGDTRYTVIYWLQNANDEGYSYLGYNNYSAEAEEKTKVDTNLEDAIGVVDNPAGLAAIRFFELNKEKSDETVTVKGDGSTVANVYYDRKEYTLKYYYAREYTNRGTTHRQICGNTSDFSDKDRDGNGTTDISTLLSYVNANWSDVTEIPALKNDNGYYQTGTEKIRHNNTEYTYYYFTIKDKYGCDLTDEWPIEALEPANLSQNINGTRRAYFSAWNPEHHIYYGQHATEEFNGNRTIKGRFQKLDRRLLYDERFGADSNNGEVRFLAFWTNSLSNQTWTKSRKWIYNIYLQDVDGNMPTTPTQTITTYDTNEEPKEQTVPSIVGFTHTDTTSRLNIDTFDGNCKVHEMNFYYKRTEFDVEFYNNGVIMEDQHYKRPYGFEIGKTLMELVKDETAVPPYPENLEEGAYYFEGWYTTADCAEGSGFIRRYTKDGEWQEGRAYYNEMDANKLILYANWKPVQHKVRFFQTYENLLDYGKSGDDKYIFTTTTNGNPHEKEFSIDHGNVVGTIDFPTYEENGQPLDFSGWFYMNNGVKTMYTPADTPVKRDLDVFADWGSQTPQPYRIQYMKYGTNEKIADDTFGYAYLGTTRTFQAKAGDSLNQLYEGYNSGWYPTVASHSITIKEEEDKDNPTENVYTFYYVKAEKIPYMVRYVDKQTGEVLHTEKRVMDNKKSVVTERFEPIKNMVPDAFYKRLVLSVKTDENGNSITTPEDNVITFYYTPSETAAFYVVHHMLQKPETTGKNPEDYVESDDHIEGTDNIGDKITISPKEQTGYTVKEDAVAVYGGDNANPGHIKLVNGEFSVEVKEEGTELYIYYALKTYGYTVKYLEHGTNNEVHTSKTGEKKQYGTVVTEKAIDVAGYTAVEPTEKSLTIRAYEKDSGEADSGKDDPNVIIFYYIPKTYVAEYKVAGGIGGTLDNYGGKAVANAEDKYDFKGSLPTPDAGFKFDGWYTDEECKNPVNKEWVKDDNRLIPQIEDMKPEPAKNIYYAKFEELKGDFTITRGSVENEGKGEQVFVYKITSKDEPSRIIYVSITGQESKTIHGLRYGTYTVEQVNDWSWRYSDESQTVVHNNENGTTVKFNKSADKQQWLNGNSNVEVNRKANKKGE